MKKKKKMSDLSIDKIDYVSNGFKWKYIPIGVAIFLIALISYFPMGEIIEKKVKTTLAKLPGGCKVSYKESKLSLFFPALSLNKVELSPRCTGTRKSVKIPRIDAKFKGLSFSPFAPSLQIIPELPGNKIDVWVAPSVSTSAINLKENSIKLDTLKNYFQLPVKLRGTALIDGQINTKGQFLDKIQLRISSRNFEFPSQMLMNLLQIQTLSINKVDIKLAMDDGRNLKIQKLVLGDNNSPIRAEFKGKITLDGRNIMASKLDIGGEVAFSNEFLEQNPLIKIGLAQFDKKDNFYQIKLRGTLFQPKPSSK
jgi:type II secretion system protein N